MRVCILLFNFVNGNYLLYKNHIDVEEWDLVKKRDILRTGKSIRGINMLDQ